MKEMKEQENWHTHLNFLVPRFRFVCVLARHVTYRGLVKDTKTSIAT